MSEVGSFSCAAHLGNGKTCRVPTDVASIEWVMKGTTGEVRVIVPLCLEHGAWLHDSENTIPVEQLEPSVEVNEDG